MRKNLHRLIFLFIAVLNCNWLLSIGLDDDLFGHYMLNGNGRDTSGTGNHGTVVKAIPVAGRFNNENQAYKFSDASNNYIEIANNTTLNPNSITVTAWVKFTGSFVGMGSNPIIEKAYATHSNPYYQYHIWAVGDQYPSETWKSRFGFSVSINNIAYSVTSTERWELNKWYMLTGTYDGNTLQFYVNGKLTESYGVQGTLSKYDTNLYIGRKGNDTTSIPAIIDDVRLYSRAISQTELTMIYTDSKIQFESLSDSSFFVKSEIPLKWLYDKNAVQSFNLDYSKDNGSTWTSIASNYTGTSYNWKCPADTISKVIIRVSDATNAATNSQIKNINIVNLSSGLKLYYPFNNNTDDKSGNGLNATATSLNYCDDRKTNANAALNFNGGYAQIPSMTFGGALSVGVWVYTDDPFRSYQRIVDFSNGTSNNNIMLGFQSTTGRIFTEIYNGTTTGGQIVTNDVFPADTWVYVLLVIDEAGKTKIYWDGKLKAEGISPVIPNVARATNYIGKSPWSDQLFNGYMDDLRVYNRAITESEIALLSQSNVKFLPLESNSFYIGSKVPLKWSLDKDSVSTVNLSYSTDNGTTWNSIASNLNTTLYEWTAPLVPGSISFRLVSSTNQMDYDQIKSNIVNINSRLKLYYPFDNSMEDKSGNNLNATATSLSYCEDRKLNTNAAASFNGGYAQIPSLTFGGALSVGAWVYTDNPFRSYQRIVDFSNGTSNNNVILGFQATTGKIFAEMFNGTTTGGQIISSDVFPAGTWVYVLLVVDETGKAKIYLDGNLKAEGTFPVIPNITRSTNYIGKSQWSDPLFNGYIDELRVYNRAITPEEITYLSKPNIKFLPLEGKTVIAGSKVPISWYLDKDSVNSVNLSYSTDNGSTWNNIASNLDTTSYEWTVPSTEMSNVMLRGVSTSNSKEIDVIKGINILKKFSGLQLYYPFEKTMEDKSGNGRDAAAFNSSYGTDRFGADSSAVYFNNGGYAKAPSYEIGGAFSLSAWVYLQNVHDNFVRIIDFSNGQSSNNIVLGVYSTTGRMFAEVYTNGTSKFFYTSDVFPANKWVHVVYTIDTAGNGKIYWDGALKGQGVLNALNKLTRTQQYIGKSAWPDPTYIGKLDEFRIFNRVLTPLEIKSLGKLYDKNIVVINPEPKSYYAQNSDIKIKWGKNADSVNLVNVKYATGKSNTWNDIAQNISVDSLIWKPSFISDSIKIRVINTAKPSEFSESGYFKVMSDEKYINRVRLPLDGNLDNQYAHSWTVSGHGISYGTDRFGNANKCVISDTMNIDVTGVDIESRFSFSLWFNTSADYTNASGQLVNSSNLHITVGNWSDTIKGNIAFYGRHAKGWAGRTIPGKAYNDGKWHFMAVTGDSIYARLYVDGVELDSLPLYFPTHKFTYQIGSYFDASDSIFDDCFNGSIDDFRVFGKTLSDQEIKELNCDRPFTVFAGNDTSVCAKEKVVLHAKGSYETVVWNNSTLDSVAFYPVNSAQYIATATSVYGCVVTDTVGVTVNELPTLNAGADVAVCEGNSVKLTGHSNASIAWNNGIINGIPFVPSVTTSYVVTATNSNNCINKDTVMVTVNALPTIDAGADVTVCQGGSVTLNAVASYPVTWNNNISDGTAFVPSATGNYIAKVTGNNGCVAADTVKITVNTCTGIAENSISDHWVKLYPTLTNGRVFIQSEVIIKAVQVYSNQGRLMDCKVTNEYIDLSNVSSGIYMVKIQTNNGWVNSKVVKY